MNTPSILRKAVGLRREHALRADGGIGPLKAANVIRVAASAVASAMMIAICPAEYRTFTSVKGVEIEAQAIQIKDAKVEIIRKSDGKKFWVPMDTLVEADRKFLEEWAASEEHSTTGIRLRCRPYKRSKETEKHWTTSYGSYDKSFISKGALLIDVANLRRGTETITVEWYFLGKHSRKEGGVFAFDGGSETVKLDSLQEHQIKTEVATIVKNVVNYAALRKKYVSGGTYYGWLAITKTDDKVTSVVSSHTPISDLYASENKWNEIFKP